MELKKIVVTISFFLICVLGYTQNRSLFEGYEYKTFEERIDFMDSLLVNDYSYNFPDVSYCVTDLRSISGVRMGYDEVVTIAGDDSRMIIIDKVKYDEYIKKLRLFSEKIEEMILIESESDSLVSPPK